MNPFIWFHDNNNQLMMINALEIVKVFSTSSYSLHRAEATSSSQP